MATANTTGGAATNSGTNYQNKVAAWFGVRMLAETGASTLWGLPTTSTLDWLRCETTEPVDDILLGLSNGGHVFIQAKHTINLGTAGDSEIAGVFDQFVRQFHAYDTTLSAPSWGRPLTKQTDRLILTTSSRSSVPIKQHLPKILDRLSKLTPLQSLEDCATSQEECKTLAVLKKHISKPWKTIKGAEPTKTQIIELASLIRVQVIDVDPGESQEREALDLLQNTVLENATDSTSAWNSIFEACATFAANKTGSSRRELQDRLTAEAIDLRVPTSYAGDVEILKQLSSDTIATMEPLAEIRLSGNAKVKVTRESTDVLRNCALSGHLLTTAK
jgi:hypothetical protein